MCIFAGAVERVQNTRIAVFTNEEWCFTAYQMEVGLLSGGNAMILPVPNKHGVQLVDMSNAKTFFDDLNDLWPQPVTRGGFSKGYAVAGSFDHLEVHKVGDYEVSVASTIDDIKRVDPTVFTLSRETEAILRHNYKGTDFSFVVAKLTQGGEVQPLGYIYDRANTDEVFIPTKHAHGEVEGSMSVMQSLKHQPEWDHLVYVQGPEFFLDDPQNRTSRIGVANAGLADHERILNKLVAAVPELEGFVNPRRRVGRVAWHGRLKNIDVRMAA
jgi:hypothetical protein